MSWLKRLTSGLKKSSSAVSAGIGGLFGKGKIDAESLDALEEALISADLGAKTAMELVEAMRQTRLDDKPDPDRIRAVLADKLTEILEPVETPLSIHPENGPHIVLLVGVNGSGKTTTAGKLAARYSEAGMKVVLAAADTFRAAAIEQLHGWGARTDTKVISGDRGGDAAALAYQAIEEAQKDKADLLIIDTAGRLQNRTELMEELAKIIRVIQKLVPEAPHDSVIVLDGTVGQNALSQVKAFQAAAGLTGLIITKLDGSAKGGIVVALAKEFALPVHMVGVGEAAEDLQNFTAQDYARALVGIDMNDGQSA